jgi:hypothetical protein
MIAQYSYNQRDAAVNGWHGTPAMHMHNLLCEYTTARNRQIVMMMTATIKDAQLD